jgi:hypothetical protein
MKPNPEVVDAAARTIQHEETKLYDGRNPPGGAGINKSLFLSILPFEHCYY